MTNEEFNERVETLTHLLRIFQRLKDKGERKKFRAIIRAEIVELTRI